ncbi:multidrug resistance-associated ABC transporter [Ramaria rubella]|nr:multidrug resistance-associated ABC transporter [Ramaria rubella]
MGFVNRKLWRPEPAPPGFAAGDVETPEHKASVVSRLWFNWIWPILWVGYTRPLEVNDLWALPETHQAHHMADRLGHQFYSRCPQNLRPSAGLWKNEAMFIGGEKNNGVNVDSDRDSQFSLEKEASSGEINSLPSHAPSTTAASSVTKYSQLRSRWLRNPFKHTSKDTASDGDIKNSKPNYSRILFGALHSTLLWRWWLAGFLKLIGGKQSLYTLQTTSPLVTKALLAWLTESFMFSRTGPVPGQAPPRGIAYGIGLAIALFGMQEISSMATNQYSILTMTNGMTLRAGIISLIFRKSLCLSGKARLKHSSGQITTLISTDATRIDLASTLIHDLWINPIQIAIGVGLLIGDLGVSALVGFGVLLLGFPIQALFVRVIYEQRKKGVKITDQRMRMTTELLQGMRLIKLYAWEMFYADKIGALREAEVRCIRTSALARAGLISLVTVISIVASVLSFITYALIGHSLTPDIIFSSLQFLNIIRTPLIYIPFVFSACSDAYVALGRIGDFLTADELAEPDIVRPESMYAVEVDGDFAWEAGMVDTGNQNGSSAGKKNKNKNKNGQKSVRGSAKRSDVPTAADLPSQEEQEVQAEKPEDKPFELQGVKIRVPKGSFVAIVGRVGSGKSSLLQAMIGEMRKKRGEIIFGGDVAYVPQTPWIMNATLRDNILFGREVDEEKFQEIIKACSLKQDLEMLPHGEMTEIGEKGINLSGGQKARVSLARAAYAKSDVVLLDDPLSAVDAHVGKDILEQCLLQGPLAGKARILVTHSLHVLGHADYIYVMENGIIAEEGTYQDLINNGHAFSRLVEDFGSREEEELEEIEVLETLDEATKPKAELQDDDDRPALMQKEERNTGQVELVTYTKYLKAAGGLLWAPFLVGLLTFSQVAEVGNNLFLGFWTAESIPGFRQGDYMAVYAVLGVAQAIFSFAESFAFSLSGLRASLNLFKKALHGVIRSPISFYDTTPMGRILSRLSKDQDVLDNQISSTLYQLLSSFSAVVGTVALVFYTFPLLGIIFAPLSILYWAFGTFYRRTSVETKRLDSLLRSALYASYSETLTGLSTVRAYGAQARFITTSEKALDVENRAYYMTIAIQRWLGVRLDLLDNILIFGIALFAVGFRSTVDPSKIGVVLSYSLSSKYEMSQMVTLFAQNEQNMNAVERITVYAELPSEAALATHMDPPPSWPSNGSISFKNVELAYREGLPLVLKDVSFEIKAGEKVGIVGRTGAGKSSLLQALFRIVELQKGSIIIDAVDCRTIGLDILRRQLVVIPQDSVLFLGSLRDNLDPLRSRTDAELISALRRVWLLPQVGVVDPTAEAKFSLDSLVGDEGSNFSVGERQLVALCRALVKDSKVIVLDEATSNVDVETDSKLQHTIQTEFSSSTLLCIAHRLNTIVYYDRVLVMDAGRVAEFDTPLNLFDRPDSIFRSLCDEANLSRQDIVKIRGSATKAV